MVGEVVARYFLAMVFITAAFLKIPYPEQMRDAIVGFELVGGSWAVFGAYFFPWLELWAGVGLLWRPARPAAGLIIVGLLAVFMAVIIWAMARGVKLNCGCFGGYDPVLLQGDNPWLLLVRDAGLMFLATVVWLRSSKEALETK